MTRLLRPLAAAAVAMLMLAGADPAGAQKFSDEQRREIGAIVRDYLLKNPEVLQEAIGRA